MKIQHLEQAFLEITSDVAKREICVARIVIKRMAEIIKNDECDLSCVEVFPKIIRLRKPKYIKFKDNKFQASVYYEKKVIYVGAYKSIKEAQEAQQTFLRIKANE